MTQPVDTYEAEAKAEELHWNEMNTYARFCPVCGQDCGEPDFEPRDESVGIRFDQWWGVCPEHGEFTVLDDGTKEID